MEACWVLVRSGTAQWKLGLRQHRDAPARSVEGGLDRQLDRAFAEQVRHREAGIPIATLGIDDAQVRPTPRRPEVVAVHDDFGLLTDDVASETEPGPTSQVEPQPD